MNIIKGLVKTVVRAPADILAGALEGLQEGIEVIGDAVEGGKDKPN